MKSLISTVLLSLAVSFTALANIETTENNCRDGVTKFDRSLSVSDRYRTDLETGVWSEETQYAHAGNLVYQFQPYGVVDILEFDKAGNAEYRSCLWRVEEYNKTPFLILSNQRLGDEEMFKLAATCNGLILTDVTSYEEIYLDFSPKKTDIRLNLKQADLVGNWSSATIPFDLNGAASKMAHNQGLFLEYEFLPNGTYVKNFGNQTEIQTETGYYEISQDGQFILFFVAEDKQIASTEYTYLARIKYLAPGELVLEQAVKADPKHQNSAENRMITFIQ
ncbi:MAG: hypothetical protein AAGH79_06090 [Bacteroidota bacterium]